VGGSVCNKWPSLTNTGQHQRLIEGCNEAQVEFGEDGAARIALDVGG
jgi:hypothetical protein